ncbi:PAS domain-containing sensor histidine kinase [Haloarcula montana]|uniref:PAS domain-containing sensor histidine kinase n=1 Tax=Haloarcula montana TaxID=3111776 RepID=UPI002D774797|nr:PAS domain-containing sensor histidine kinase [Haloarcula sp. GH36]
MSGEPRRLGIAVVVGASGLAVASLGASDIYVDAVRQGDPLWTTLVENSLSLSIALALCWAAVWLWRAASGLQVRQMSRWFGVAAGAIVVVLAVVVGSQSLQSQFKPVLVAVAAGGLTLLAGLGIGRYDADRIAQRRAVEHERDKFAALFENVPNPVIAVQFEHGEPQLEMANPAFEEVFGYTESELAGRDLRSKLRPPEEEAERVDRTERSVAPQTSDSDLDWTEMEVTLDTDYGQREFIRVTAPAGDGSPEAEYAYYVDVTERNQRRERLQVLSRTLRHDIRNRMDIAYGTAEVLEEDLDGDAASLAGQIQTAISDLQRISEQTREIERVVSGEYESYSSPLSALVADAVDGIREEYPAASVRVDLGEVPPVRANDAVPVAIENVLENAVAHNDRPEPSVEITASTTTDGGYVTVRVADDGPGIPRYEYELLQDERDRSQLEHTSGLGLWEVSWILRNLGGSLDFAENDPRGTVVALTLPKADEPPTASRTESDGRDISVDT